MKILVISDIHGNLPALEAVLNSAPKVDRTICLGDLAGYYPFINEVIETVSSLNDCSCLKGNHDYVLVTDNQSTGSKSADMAIEIQRKLITDANKEFLSQLPESLEDVVESRCLRMFHGTPKDPLNGRKNFWEDELLQEGIYFFGHSHKPVFEQNSDIGWMVVNPVGCGLSRDGKPGASYAIVDTINWRVDFCRADYPFDFIAQKCREVGLPDKFSKSLEVGYWVSDCIR